MRIFVIILFAVFFHAEAATYYVSPTGDDTTGDGSQGLPWRTGTKAATVAVAGDTVRFQAGDYPERVVETTDGSAGNYITYIADGVVTIRGFHLNGSDRVRVIGFEITHASNLGYAGIQVSGAYCEILDNYIHHTSGNSILPTGADHLIIRDNILLFPGRYAGSFPIPDSKKIIDDGGSDSTYVVVEYNIMSHTPDYLCPRGSYWIFNHNVMGPSFTDDYDGTPHVDGWQSNAQTKYGWMMFNWHVDNSVSDSHMILIENPVNGRNGAIVVAKNVSLRSGDQLWYQMRDGTNLYNVHNTVGQVGFGPRGGPASSGFIRAFSEEDHSINNYSRNNIYTNVTTGTVYDIAANNQINHSHDLVFPASTDLVNGVNGDIELDPKFVDYAATNLLLHATSPVIDVGTNLTTVTSASSTGTSFVVGDSTWFHDGFGLTVGSIISVGDDNNLIVTAVDHTTHTITVSSSFTWTNGDLVSYRYLGTKPDLGAYEFGDTLLSSATYVRSGTTYTGTPVGDCEKFIFYQDGIPHTIDSVAPFTATISSGTVTVEAFAARAQYNPVIAATDVTPIDSRLSTTILRVGTIRVAP